MIHLVIDSTAYMPEALLKQWNLHTISLKITMGDVTLDEDKIPQDTFYSYLESAEKAPTTSQPPVGEFIELYTALLQSPADEILSIHLSGGLSGTAQAAELAASNVAPERITVVDSRSTTGALAMLVLAAAHTLRVGASRAEAAERVRALSQKHAGIFMVSDLQYLAKGGRINGAAKFLNSVLQVRPILYLHAGKIDGLALARTRKRGLQQMLGELEKRVGDCGQIYAAVTHIQAEEEARALAAEIKERFDCLHLILNETGPVIGSHVGPGFIGVAGCPVVV